MNDRIISLMTKISLWMIFAAGGMLFPDLMTEPPLEPIPEKTFPMLEDPKPLATLLPGHDRPHKAKAYGMNRTAHIPESDPEKLVLKYAFTIPAKVSAYTRFDDPGNPWRKTYASVNFLPGGALFDPKKPWNRKWVKPRESDYVVAIPRQWKMLFESRIQDGYFWPHRYRLEIPGYTKPGRLAIPGDRITSHDRFDVFMTGSKCQTRAVAWGVKDLLIDVHRYDWEVQEDAP